MKNQKKDGRETAKSTGTKRASAAQLRITKGERFSFINLLNFIANLL